MNFLYIPSTYQISHANTVRRCVPDHNVIVKNSDTKYLTEITTTIHKLNRRGHQVHGIIVSNAKIINKYVSRLYGREVVDKSTATLDQYQGALFEHIASLPEGDVTYKIPVVVIPEPMNLQYSQAAQFLTTKYISKLYDTSWFQAPDLQWHLLDDRCEFPRTKVIELLNSPECILVGVDIETKLQSIPYTLGNKLEINGVSTNGMWYEGYARTEKGNKAKRLEYQMPLITCVGYTAILRHEDGSLSSITFVLPLRTKQDWLWMQKFNATTAPKTMQNGRYDSTYFLRYNAPLHNYAFDTYMLMHSWYCELKRDLAKISALVIRNHMYWKDESGTNLYEYNAKDCHATAWATLALLQQMPDWAIKNFTSYFKQIFPCITCALEGFKEDPEESDRLWHEYQARLAADRKWWDTVLVPHFNYNSSPQTKQLFQGLLGTRVQKCDAPTLKGIKHKHPLWRLMVDKLLSSREATKANSTYMNIVLFAGRILYELDPAGTDTGRYASKTSSFWCGTQIQNIPPYAKSKFIADNGWVLNAVDNAQSESRTTAYVTHDKDLIDAVENSKDFHVRNASKFFGISEDTLFEYKATGNPLYKIIRNDIGKRVNHGANYNMMENVLINTMTPENIIKAKHALQLPGRFTLKDVAKYLLDCFDQAYTKIRSRDPGGYHRYIIDTVEEHQRLITPCGWTRYTFHTDPANNKRHMNQLVAHLPQSWSVKIINRSFYDAWKQYQIVENKMRMKAQVHDEILYQTRPADTEYVTAGISKLMARPNQYTDIDGNVAYMVIPNDPITSKSTWAECKD